MLPRFFLSPFGLISNPKKSFRELRSLLMALTLFGFNKSIPVLWLSCNFSGFLKTPFNPERPGKGSHQNKYIICGLDNPSPSCLLLLGRRNCRASPMLVCCNWVRSLQETWWGHLEMSSLQNFRPCYSNYRCSFLFPRERGSFTSSSRILLLYLMCLPFLVANHSLPEQQKWVATQQDILRL